MADRTGHHQLQVHPLYRYDAELKNMNRQGLSKTTILAVVTGVPISGTLLALAGLTLMGTLIGLAVAFPIFIIFSPVLVPAALAIGLAVAAILTSGVFGLTGLASLARVLPYIRHATEAVPGQLDQAKRRMADMASYVGQKTKETGQDIQSKAQEVKRS